MLQEGNGVAAKVLLRLGLTLPAAGERVQQLAAQRADRPRQDLAAERTRRQDEWSAAHPDLPSLAVAVREIGDQLQQFRGTARPADPGPDATTA